MLLTKPPEDPFEFGSLHDLSVEILPTQISSVVQVLQGQAFPMSVKRGELWDQNR